jgi:hypothetical protein
VTYEFDSAVKKQAIRSEAAFSARYPCSRPDDSGWVERHDEWLQGRWKTYSAQVAFINYVYLYDNAVRERLLAAIYPNASHDDDGCYWIGECEDILVEANKRGKDRVFDRDANLTFEFAAKGIGAFMEAAPEFRTRKANVFFARYAINAVILSLQAEAAEAKWMFRFQVGLILACNLVQLVITAGVALFGAKTDHPWVALTGDFFSVWTVFWVIIAIAGWVLVLPKRWRIFASVNVALDRYRAIVKELYYPLSLDPEIILNRLQAVESDLMVKVRTYAFPSYIYSLVRGRV